MSEITNQIYNWHIFYQMKTPGRMYPKPSAGYYHDPNSIVFLFCSPKYGEETLATPCFRSI